MIYLNLISEEIKQKINLKGIYELIRSGFLFLLIFLVFISGLFYGASKFLENYLNNVVSSNLIQATQGESAVYEISSMINSLADIQLEFRPWTLIWGALSDSLNPGITLINVKINKADNLFVVEGVASDRASLNDFKEDLAEQKFFSGFEIFNYDIFQKENIVFNIRANIITLF